VLQVKSQPAYISGQIRRPWQVSSDFFSDTPLQYSLSKASLHLKQPHPSPHLSTHTFVFLIFEFVLRRFPWQPLDRQASLVLLALLRAIDGRSRRL